MDKLLDEAKSLSDVKKRKKLYDKIQKILYERGTEAIPYFKDYVSAVRKEVHNYKLIPVQYVDLRETWVKR